MTEQHEMNLDERHELIDEIDRRIAPLGYRYHVDRSFIVVEGIQSLLADFQVNFDEAYATMISAVEHALDKTDRRFYEPPVPGSQLHDRAGRAIWERSG